jgi:hypothetical protein
MKPLIVPPDTPPNRPLVTTQSHRQLRAARQVWPVSHRPRFNFTWAHSNSSPDAHKNTSRPMFLLILLLPLYWTTSVASGSLCGGTHPMWGAHGRPRSGGKSRR